VSEAAPGEGTAQPDDAGFDDYDIFSAELRNCPHQWWARMQQECPVAHSDRFGGSWLVTRFADIKAMTRDPELYSSRVSDVGGPMPGPGQKGLFLPPITSDPPEHAGHRGVLLPFLVPARVAELEPFIREKAAALARVLAEQGGGDAATGFAQQLAISVLTRLLDVPAETAPRFIEWTVRLLRTGPLDQAARAAVVSEMIGYFDELLRERAAAARAGAVQSGMGAGDLITYLTRPREDGQPLNRKQQIGSALVIMIAGADTTWSALSASLLHLGTHPADRRRLREEPKLMSTAIEELLRAYAPVMLARVSTQDTDVHGRHIPAGERMLFPLAAANRDPEVFEDPDQVKLDRRRNAHLAFGSGAHRCLGSPLARLEMRVALEEWLAVIPEFEVTDPGSIEWTGGTVRGPETVPFRVLP
jgi:cytochrome P450